jgi:hypothetical protein
VMRVGYDTDEIRAAVRAQVGHGRYASSDLYYRPGASQSIVDVLASVELYTQKRFHETVQEPASVRPR